MRERTAAIDAEPGRGCTGDLFVARRAGKRAARAYLDLRRFPEKKTALCRGSGNQARNVLGGLSSLPGIWPTKETVVKEIR